MKSDTIVMGNIIFKPLTEAGGLQVVEFDIPGGVCSPSDLAGVGLPEGLDFKRPVAFSGRGPVWLFCHLSHLAHPAVAVFTMDPRVGFVCVQSHTPQWKVGDVVNP